MAALIALPIACAVAGGAVAWKRFGTTDEQDELRRYVELSVPSLLARERAANERIDRLSSRPGPSPAEARALLVDDVVPRLVSLRRQAESIEAHTPALKSINAEYLGAVDALIEACRSAVRAIDDPALPADAGQRLVREKFLAAGRASRAWSEHLRDACVRARLSPPPAR